MRHQGAVFDRLTADWSVWITDPREDWLRDARTLGARGWDCYANDPVLAAMVNCKLDLTHGQFGLRFRSLYQIDGAEETDPAEQKARLSIEDYLAWASYGASLDAGGQFSRRQLERAADLVATIAGDCALVKVWAPGRPRATTGNAWRLVRPERISNPDGRPDTDRLFAGIEMDDSGVPVAIHVETTRMDAMGTFSARTWQRFPFFSPDGSPAAVMRYGKKFPGCPRGFSMYAPLLLLARQIAGTLEAHVVGKRAQAVHPLVVKTDDPAQTKAAQTANAWLGPNVRMGPGRILFTSKDNDVAFPQIAYQGADLRDFLDTAYRSACAAWQLPFQVVLCQLTNANLAASRAAMMQSYRTAAGWQEDHLDEVTRPLDEAILREGIATRRLLLPVTSAARLLAGRHIRPPRSMPDPLKEAQAAEKWAAMGRAFSDIFDEQGWDFAASVRGKARDRRIADAQGIDIPGLNAPAATGATAADPIEPDGDDQVDDSTDTTAADDAALQDQPA